MVDRVGQKLGNYRITGSLGHGGFAEVYLAEHIYLKTLVAIKVLYTRISYEEEMESFVKEAQTIALLSHPQIIRVLDFGVDNETPYLMMDYAAHGNLRQRFPRGTRIPLPTVVSYVQQIADALQYAHDKGFIHQDIKPENILLNQNNAALLSDFGLAKVKQHSSSQKTDAVAGTAQYMSPEQFKGRPRPASDQYSLAIIVYEWLCGEPPFTAGDFIQLGFQHTYEPVPALSEKIATIAPDVNQVVMTALAKDAKQRFGSVKAFANALEQAAGMKQAAEPIGRSPVPLRDIPAPVEQQAGPTPIPPVAPPPTPVLPVQGRGEQVTQFESVQPVQNTPLAQSEPVRPVQNTPLPQAESVRMANSDALGDSNSARPITAPSPIRQTIVPRPVKTVNMWTFGRKQLLVLSIGLILYVAVFQIRISLFNFNIFMPLLIFLTFGLLFGPWMGLIIAGVGFIISQALFSPSASFLANILVGLGLALMGFAAGLVGVITKGRYRTFGTALIGSFLAEVVVSIGFFILLNSLHESSASILAFILSNSIIPLLLFILLPIYDRIAYRNKPA